ncbi:stage II sporulation protein M [Saccharopolyspora karakumensis]|uniref:Stage II sporulation protein M n=1 Tax=Saccharopolyspora karakumensis TaxID=2530386 RepID=A0A4R5BZH4_9PSEU|nr:stage II sporulation protein M [Saccharopolyspora karakumensis]
MIRANLGAYLALNAMAYGLFLVGMGVGLLRPELTAANAVSLQQDGTLELVTWAMSSTWLFSLIILAVNTVGLSLVHVLLPSAIVPFGGIAVFAFWTFDTGVTLAPINEVAALTMIPHSLTVLIEFQAYVLVLLGAYRLGMSWLRPGTVGARTRRQGYVHGLRQVGRLSPPALALLVVGAIYEAVEIIHLVPLLLS